MNEGDIVEFNGAEWVVTGSRQIPWSNPISKPTNPLESATDADLIFELLGRGYAVAKLPPEKLAENL